MDNKDTSTPQPQPQPQPAGPAPIPTALVRRRRFSIMWLIPIIALAAVALIVWNQVAQTRGPTITIIFNDAGGLEPNSKLVHRGVTVGVVRTIALTKDLQAVKITAELRPDAAGLAVEGTRFWLVRAKVSLQGVTGLDTLIAPRYIALEPAPPSSTPATTFAALDAPPVLAPPTSEALRLTLRADRLGTLAPASPVLYREIQIGSVRSAHLAPDATGVLITIDIEPRYAPLVHENTRFWRSGGVGVDFGLFKGLSVEADSLQSVLSASISLATPEKRMGDPATTTTPFDLADSPDSEWLKWRPVIEVGG